MQNRKVIETKEAPSNKNVIWLKEGVMYRYGYKGWYPINHMTKEDKVKLDTYPSDYSTVAEDTYNKMPEATQESKGLLSAEDKEKIDTLQDNYAALENGKVSATQLPSYVDDVLEYESPDAFPEEGEAGKIYVALSNNLTYRWSGSACVEISQSLALGETSNTAYYGDKGKKVTEDLAAHVANTSNPHGVTKDQVGLGNVDNTADADKPVSNAVQTALDKKVDKVEGKSLVPDADILKLSHLSDQDTLNTAIADAKKAGTDAQTTAEGKFGYAAVARAASNASLYFYKDYSTAASNSSATLDTVAFPVVSVTQAGIMTASDKTKLDGIAENAQVNTLESVKVNGTALSVTDKAVNIPIAGSSTLGLIKNNSGSYTLISTNDKMGYPVTVNTDGTCKAEVNFATSNANWGLVLCRSNATTYTENGNKYLPLFCKEGNSAADNSFYAKMPLPTSNISALATDGTATLSDVVEKVNKIISWIYS